MVDLGFMTGPGYRKDLSACQQTSPLPSVLGTEATQPQICDVREGLLAEREGRRPVQRHMATPWFCLAVCPSSELQVIAGAVA